jgi:hypothetical protein
MIHARRKAGLVAAIAAGALAFTLTPAAANAATAPTAELTGPRQFTMTVGGYDAAVAEANGYKIVTHADGSQESVPVTPAAKAREAAKPSLSERLQSSKAAGEVTPYDEVVGNCGLSYLDGSKGANDTISYDTGFVVRDAVKKFRWVVNANGFLTSDSKSYSGKAGDAEWGTSGSVRAVGPGTAFVAGVSAAAAATLIDGSICYSGGPSFGFN